jgi:AcrR family transcriptional regulator
MEDKKRCYIEKIALLYREHGIKPLSMEVIASHIGLSKKSLYNYFDSKEKMIDAVFQFHFERIRKGFIVVASEKINAIEKLLKVSDLLYQFFEEFSQPMLQDLRKLYPYLSHKNRNSFREHLTKEIEHNIREGIAENLYVKAFSVNLITHHFVSSLQHLLLEETLSDKELTPAIAYKQVIIYHIRGIATTKGIQELENHLANAHITNTNPQKIA